MLSSQIHQFYIQTSYDFIPSHIKYILRRLYPSVDDVRLQISK